MSNQADLKDILHSALQQLLPGIDSGEEIAAGVKLVALSSEFGPKLVVKRNERTFHLPVVRQTEADNLPASGTLLGLRFDMPPEASMQEQEDASEVCRAVMPVLEPNEQAYLNVIERYIEHTESQTGVREVEVDRLLEFNDRLGYPLYFLNPSLGCLTGCPYCYAQDHLHRLRNQVGLPKKPWGSYADVRVNAPKVLEQELRTLRPAPIMFSPISSDPYQAFEKKYEITRRCLEVIRDADDVQWSVLIMTRSTLIARDLDVLQRINHLGTGFSIPSFDDGVRRHFEPRAASISERFRVLKLLKEHGIQTFVVAQPMLPGPVDAFADALASVTSSVRLSGLSGLYGAEAEFNDPKYAFCKSPEWQQERISDLAKALTERGVTTWDDELPTFAREWITGESSFQKDSDVS